MHSGRLPLALLAAVAVALLLSCGGENAQRTDAPAVTTVDGQGRFSAAPSDSGLSTEQQQTIARLEAIGYAQGVSLATEDGGVKRLDIERAWPGVALYVSGHAPEALLVDLEGRVLHRWHAALEEVWPRYATSGQKHHARFFFRRAWPLEDGSLLVIFEGYGIVKLDRGSNVVWAKPNRAHHDLDVQDDGRIVTLTRTAHLVPRLDAEQPKLEDFIVVLDENGHELSSLSLLEALERSRWRDQIHAVDPRLPERIQDKARAGDLFHTNSVEIVREDHPTIDWMKKGRAIVSLRFLSAVMAVDLEQRRVVWFHRGDFVGQHEPTLLADGNVLLFDNGNHSGQSRALEIDPGDGRVVWHYPGDGDPPLFSQCCSTATRLPNGNSQLVVTDMGRALEVTPDGEIVWEFVNPNRAGERNELVAALFDLVRLPAGFPTDWTQQTLASQ